MANFLNFLFILFLFKTNLYGRSDCFSFQNAENHSFGNSPRLKKLVQENEMISEINPKISVFDFIHTTVRTHNLDNSILKTQNNEATTEDGTTDSSTVDPEESTTTQRSSTSEEVGFSPTTPGSVIEEPGHQQFFKKPVGYITAGVGLGLLLVVLGTGVGYLHLKRKRLLDSGKLNLVKNMVVE